MIETDGIYNKYTSTGRHSGYQIDLYHTGLDEHKNLSASEEGTLRGKIHNQVVKWEEKWEKELIKQDQQSKEQSAIDRTQKAQERIKQVEGILDHTLDIDDTIDWDSLKDFDEFVYDDTSTSFIFYDEENGYPQSISKIDIIYKPWSLNTLNSENKIGAIDIILGKKDHKIESINKKNSRREKALNEEREEWKRQNEEFVSNQSEHNSEIDEIKAKYLEKNNDSIIEYCEMVLDNSEYPDSFPQIFLLQYNEVNGMLLIDYDLPKLSDMPSVNNVRYIKSRDEIEEKTISQAQIEKLYDSSIYQISLRTLHEIFEADAVDAIKSINFNGIVTDVNPATGHEESKCIVSIQAKKDEFEAINLEGIVKSGSFKECFKSLRGVGSSKLSTITPVKPILELDKSDKRFRNHYEVAQGLDDKTILLYSKFLED